MNVNFEYYKVFYHVCACGQSYSCRPGLVHLPAGCKPGCEAAGKGSRDKAVLPHFQRGAADPGRELLYHYVKPGVEELLEGGKMLERMLNMDVGKCGLAPAI